VFPEVVPVMAAGAWAANARARPNDMAKPAPKRRRFLFKKLIEACMLWIPTTDPLSRDRRCAGTLLAPALVVQANRSDRVNLWSLLKRELPDQPGSGAALALPVVDPRHHRAQVPADLLDLLALCLLAHALEVLLARLVLGDPLLRELARLDVREDLLHRLAGLVGDHARAAGHVAVLGRVRDRVAHALDAVLVHQVDDQLQLVQALEVGEARV